MTLEEAKAKGRRLGEHESDRQRIKGQERAERIRRAEKYAIWAYGQKCA